MSDMENKTTRILTMVFPVVFNLLFFTLPVRRDTASWICWGFIHLAYLLLLTAIFYTGSSRRQFQNRAAIAMRIWSYFLAELVVGSLLIILNTLMIIRFIDLSWASFIIQLLLFGVFFIIALSMLLANRHDEEVELVNAKERQFIQGSTETMRALLDKGPSQKANKAIETVYDKLRTSPTASCPEAKQIEAQIRSKLETLNNLSSEEEILGITSEILDLIQTRNSVLQMSR